MLDRLEAEPPPDRRRRLVRDEDLERHVRRPSALHLGDAGLKERPQHTLLPPRGLDVHLGDVRPGLRQADVDVADQAPVLVVRDEDGAVLEVLARRRCQATSNGSG